MWIVIVHFSDGSILYFGPFRTHERAWEYGIVAVKDLKANHFNIAEIVIPHRN